MDIIGHKKILALLDKSIAQNRVSQSYLFSGPEAVGKFTVALDFAQKIAPSDSKINPNLTVIASEKDVKTGKLGDIKAEDMRELRRKLILSAEGTGCRVAIIDDADRMNKAAQNILLKTLEEPSEGVVIILVVQDEKRILPTILSRCQIKRFGLVSDEDLKKISGGEEIIFWAMGRPGWAKKMTENSEELDWRKNSLRTLKVLLSADVNEKFSLAEEMNKDGENAIRKLRLWQAVFRGQILGNHSGIEADAEKSFRLVGRLEESLQKLRETNVSARLVLENLFLEF